MQRVIIHAWFPHLAAERVRRAGGVPDDQPLVLTSAYHGADLIDSACRLATRRGLHVGMRLADARSLYPHLVSRDSDHDADAQALLHLARWARRYCPLTAPAGGHHVGAHHVRPGALIARDGNGIWLDVAGAAHLHGGVRPLLADMARRVRKAGLTMRLAVAPTCGAAWALARYGPVRQRYGCTAFRDVVPTRQLSALLADLPLAALRLDGTVCTAMAASGLRRIGDILNMPRAPLAARFGSQVTSRLDAALGHVNESFTPIAPVRPRVVMQAFAEPIAAPEDIHAVIDHLAGEVAEMLRRDGMASRRLQLGWQRVDGAVLAHDVHLSRPSRDAAGFRRLLASAGEAVNPEFGLERMWMEAHDCSPQAPTAIGFDDGISVSESRASLIDRLVARLGHGAVLHFKSRECWQPEAAQYMAYPDMEEAGFVPSVIDGQVDRTVSGQVDRYLSSLSSLSSVSSHVSSHVSSNGGGAGACLTAAPRPIRLLAHPHRLSVVALLPDHPPAQFTWNRQTHRIVRASGPERIAPQWWDAAAGTRTRDYFRLQDDQGARFWVYREGLPERGEDPDWFLHGFFA